MRTSHSTESTENAESETSWPSAIAAGIVVGGMSISLTVAYASLVFRDDLASFVGRGVGLNLAGGLIGGLVVALSSRVRGHYAGPQDTSALVLGVGAASIAASTTAAYESVVTLIAISTATIGLFLYAMGRFHLGGLLRYLPHPVMAGFLGGTGLVMLSGSVDLMLVDAPLADALETDVLVRWTPALVIGAIAFYANRRMRHRRMLIPTVLGVSVVVFHLGRVAAGIDRDEALERGWLLGPFPDGQLFTFDTFTVFGDADWGAVASAFGSALPLLVLLPVALLMYLGAIEHDLDLDIDTDRELRINGLANIASASVGSLASSSQLVDTSLSHRIAPASRAAAVISAGLCGIALVVGEPILGLIPVPVTIGVLVFIGFDFVANWLWDGRLKMPISEYVLALAIAATVLLLGFLAGVGAGILAAVGLFIVRYSRTESIRTELNGTHRRSNVQRQHAEDAALAEFGSRAHIIELQGFLFFGTAASLLEPIRERLEVQPSLTHLVIDFRSVTGVDSSAAASLDKLAKIGTNNGFQVCFSAVPERLRGQLIDSSGPGTEHRIRFEPDLDHALEWIEEDLLASIGVSFDPPESIEAWLSSMLRDDDAAGRLLSHLVLVEASTGSVILAQGAPPDGLYFLLCGSVTASLEQPGRARVRLRTIRAGSVFGEMSTYLEGPVTSTITADGPCTIYHLPPDRFAALQSDDPEVAAALHSAMARLLTERAAHNASVISDILS